MTSYEKLSLEAFEDKTSKNNKPYVRFKTNAGWVSCWEAPLMNELKEFVNKGELEANVETNNAGYKSIKGFKKPSHSVSTPQNSKKESFNPTTMYVSYAKDIFNALAMGLGEEDPVKRHETLEYYADFAGRLVVRMKNAVEEELEPKDPTEMPEEEVIQ